ncbi:hypothetical protein BOTBODRAFT_178166 [Botryobasidium botryosum FD-172 SS1]|uniref:AA1-like domain-containing protein n=1 Tax=Botryobasidium botryosum (strain FD-172 SS1) TaxID=930990 RepID=A0A067M4M8_BOTB1|nr:hypothetical protein BOTBODRAFT_178166 [Botryobasidium botryosum FD-172 SS1]
MRSLRLSLTLVPALASIAQATPIGTRAQCAGISSWGGAVYYVNPDGSFRNQISASIPCPAGDRQVKVSVIDLATCAPIVTSLGALSESIGASVYTIDYSKNIFEVHANATSAGTPITLSCKTQAETSFGITAEFITASLPPRYA